MRVLITWGSKLGGTEGIADMLAAALEHEGLKVDMRLPHEVKRIDAYDAVIVGGGLYANRWQRDARRFVSRHAAQLRLVPVWFFSSGPLDDSAATAPIPPTREVAVLMERVGAQGHATFGGRLAPDAQGFPARAMAKTRAGDWRRPELIEAWGQEIARALPTARPGASQDPPGGSLHRLMAHALAGGAACAIVAHGLALVAPGAAAVALHALVAPLVFFLVARSYFHGRGAREALPTALCFAGTTLAMEAAVAGLMARGALPLLASFGRTWLPLILAFLVTWATGALMATMPWPTRKAGTLVASLDHR